MNQFLKELFGMYGGEVVVGRILEQLKLLAFSDEAGIREKVIAARMSSAQNAADRD